MAVTGTGMFGLSLELLRTLLASLSATQAWMGVDGQDDPAGLATKRVYINQLPDDLSEAGTRESARASQEARPLIVIGEGDTFEATEDSTGSPWSRRADLWVDFEEVAQNDTGKDTGTNTVTDPDALMHLMNNVGAIMAEAESAVSSTAATAQVDGAVLDMIGYNVIDPAARTASEERGPSSGIDLCGMKLTIRRRDR